MNEYGYIYKRPEKGKTFRTHEGGTCAKLPPLDLSPKKRTITQYIGLACLFPLASLAIAWTKTMNLIQASSEIGLKNHPLNTKNEVNA
jgi:hypothetical protein